MKSKVRSIKAFLGIEKSLYEVTNKDVVQNNILFIDTFIKSIVVIPAILFVIMAPLSLISTVVLSNVISSHIHEMVGVWGEVVLSFGLIVEIPLGALVWSLFRTKLDKGSLLKNILSHLYSVIYIIPCLVGIYYGNLWQDKHYSMFWSIPIIIIIVIPILRYIVIYFKAR